MESENIAMRFRCQRKTALEKQMIAMNSDCSDFQQIRPRGGRFIGGGGSGPRIHLHTVFYGN